MLKILFNRSSSVVRFLELIGALGSVLYLKHNLHLISLNTGLFLFLLATYFFIRFCDLKNWYPREDRSRHKEAKIGIEVHFHKALVPTSYILAITSFFCLLGLPFITPAILVIADLMMSVVVLVNGILICFHKRDKDSLPVNYFSSNQYLQSYEKI